jgi:hypothetical protein
LPGVAAVSETGAAVTTVAGATFSTAAIVAIPDNLAPNIRVS